MKKHHIKSRNLNILIFGDLFTFPTYNAPAPTNRILAYTKGFRVNGQKSYVITFSNIYTKFFGCYKQVPYFIPLRQSTRNQYFILRRWFKLLKYFNTVLFIYKLKRKCDNNIVILYSRTPSLILFARLLCSFFSMKLYMEVNEIPTNDVKTKIGRWLFPRLLLPLFDGFICISGFLESFCLKYKRDKANIIRVPILCSEPDYTLSDSKNLYDFQYILYSGTLSFHRDGIDILIKAMALISERFPELKLILGGNWVNNDTKEQAIQLISELGISESVIITGFLPSDEYQSLLQNAYIYCIPRKETEQTKAAFPTKLIDYLRYSKPIAVTSVGDITDYFTEDAIFLVTPDSVSSLVERLIQIIINYSEALFVTKKGNIICNQKFNYIANTKRMIDFFTE